MIECIRTQEPCLGRDCRELPVRGNLDLCCREEIQEEKETVLNLIDTIDDCTKDHKDLLKVSYKLSYAAHTINHNSEEELIEVFLVIKRFSLLMHEFYEKILNDQMITELTCSFTHELQRWFKYRFLKEEYPFAHSVQFQSILADMNTIEMGLGVCMIPEDYDEEALDDLFF